MKSEEKEVVLTPEAKRVVDFLIRVKFSTAAKATGLSTAALYNIKSGRNNASKDVIFALEKAFPNDPEASFSWLNDGIMPEIEQSTSPKDPINPGPHSDGYNPLKEAYEQLMERVRMLESYNEDLREDKKHLQEDKKRLERKNTALLKKMGVPVDEESFNEAGLSSLSVVHRNMQIASKQGA